MRIESVALAAAFLAFVNPMLAPGQQPPIAQPSTAQPQPGASQASPYSLKVRSQLVVLDVVVTDKQGHTVTNLGKDDFQVYEDKVSQTLYSVDPPQSHAVGPNVPIHSTAELDKLEPEAPVSIIVLDEMNTRFQDEAFARYSLRKYLDTQGDTLQQPTMLVAADLRHFMVLRDYTTSKQEILSALEHHLAAYPWHVEGGSWKNEQFTAAFASLMEVAEATTGHPGHKNMIWIGRGFPGISPAALPAYAKDALQTAIETCTNMLRDARVTLYTVDPVGISSDTPAQDEAGFDEDDPLGGQVDFSAMAKATGGKPFFGRNDVDHLIGTSVRDGVDFYTLSYVPSTAKDDAKNFRNIRVVMKNPNLRATTREGYYAHSVASPPATDAAGKPSNRLLLDLSIASNSMMIYDGVPFTIVRDPAIPDRFKLHINGSEIPWRAADGQKLSADLTLLVESFDKKGKLLNRDARILTVLSPGSSAAASSEPSPVNLEETISTRPPAARLRFVLCINGNNKVGADNFFLVDPKTLSNTGLAPTKH